MVRETRYLWVGNLPENIREDRIREHFKRYGRVQSVKLLPRGEVCPVDGGSSSTLGEGNEGGSGSSSGGSGGGGGGGGSSSSGVCATVAFMDIKSAAKAHAIEHTLDDRVLTAQYYEPQHLQHRFPSHGSSEDHGSSGGSGGGNSGTGGVSGGSSGSGSTGPGVGGNSGGNERGERGSESFDSRGSHGSFYGSERSNRVVGTGSSGVVGSGGSGSGSGVVGGHPADSSTGDPSGYISRRPPPTSSYHVTSSRARDRLYPRTGPYVSGPPPPPHLDRHRGSLPPSSWSTYEPTSSRYGSAPPPPSPATNDSYQDEQGGGGGGGSSNTGALRQHKKQRRKSRSGSSSPSGSSRSGSSSSSRSGSSGGSSSGGSTSPGSSPHRTSNVSVIEDRRPVAICVRNLPIRSSDSSLKDGLFHEYKKHGKVTWVKVIGTANERYALVCFRKPEDVEKALEVSQDKLFFGCKIEVAPYQGYDVEDNEFRPYEAELDEYHPKATRTLFIGNLEKDVTASELRKHFEQFGEIIEIDIKKQGAVSSYAFCQYSDIGSVVKAMRSMDGEHLGANRIKLGFGKSMPTPCVWVDGIGDCTSEKFLSMQFNTFGPTTQIVIDRERGHALVFFDQISCAQAAVKDMRGATFRGRRLQIDFASRECQETFYEHLERQGNTSEKPWDSRPSPASSFDMTRERNSFDSAVTVPSSSNRFTRYDTPPRSRTTNYSRTSGGSTPGASPAHPTALSRSNRRSYQDSYYDGDYAEPASRRFRSYDEFSQGSGASHDDYQSSVLSDGKLNDDDCPPPSRRHAVQSVVTSIDPPAPPPPLLPPPDIRHLQKERVHLLEQLEECHSSGDEVGFVSKKRAKLDNSSTAILCEDEEPEIASLLVTSHSSRKGMDFRRVSDNKVVVHHSTRRGSCEGRGPGPCKRRRDATSRHHEHHDGSRPGTPLVDERPENLVPSEPRRFRERSHEGPLSLPLPRFAAQMLNNNNNTSSSNNNNGSGTRSNNASLAKIASPPCASLSTVPSPRAAPQPPASPPPRHTSSSPTSSDSETAPQSPSLEERIRSLDEKYEKWSGSRALSAAGGDALAKLDASASERFRFRHKLLDLDLHEVQPSDIVKSVLAKRSVFDEDSKRLENFSEKYEPREFTGVIGVSSMIGSTAGLTTSDGGCTSKVCLQYPFPSHPPIQPASGTSVTSQIGINTSLSASLTPMTTMVSSALKTDPRMVQHNCIHPTPATPITPGTSIKTVSPELPPVSLPIGLGSGTAASNSNGSGLASASSLLSSSGSVGNIHTLGTSTHRGLSISATTASPTVTAASDAFNSTAITTAMPITTLNATISSATVATTMSVTGAVSSMTITSSIAPPSSITSSSNSSSSSSLSASSTDLPRSRLRKETSGSNRESRDSRDGRDSRESKHSKGKDCQRRSRKDEADVERNRKDRDEKESANIVNDVGNTDNHNRDFKDNKEVKYERKEREEKERRDKEDRDRQERRDKEDRDRQEKKEREERERREKDEERRERERLDKERQEKDRREREERERERKEKEENELKEKERREKERIDRERREREEKERQERREREERERREREEREKKEREIRLEREKQEKERLRREREEQERREKEERDRIERERRREEKERLERERKREKEEKERLERERRKEKEEREKMEKEKREKEERERLEKLEREKHEREKRREREDQERREKEKAEREKRRDREEKDKEKRERDDTRRQSTENHLHPVTQSQTQVTSAPVAIKRRCSSQDCPTDEDAKRMKISDHRRDSKDRSRQNRRSEDRKHRNDSHRSSRESRESRDSKESSSATQDTRDGESTRENNSRDSGNKEKQRSKKNRSEKESRERSPRVSHESDKEFLSRLELSKRNDSTLSTEQASVGSNHTRDVQHHQQQQSSTLNSHSDVDDGLLSTHEIQTVRNPSATDTDSDEPKKHSIFDIVDDEPAYISMYDKVKARSTKNMQKLEEEKRQVRLKDKFSQLKQSRARREEKKQSTSWDGDSVSSKALTEDEATSESDSTRTKSLSRKGSRSRIHSDTSEEEEPFNNKVRKSIKTERFLESDVDLGFADTEEKQNPLEASNVIVNSVHTNIKEEPRTSDEDERIAVSFRTNHPTIVVNNHERDSRKKSHKKKQKRQKNSISSENNIKVEPTEPLEHKNKTNLITSSNTDCRPNHGTELTAITAATAIGTTALENAEERMRADKKQRSKKDKRRDRNGEDKAKARRKRLNRQEARDSQRMEDIFGPLSDDVDDAPSNTHTFFNRFNNMTSENSVYASDSDGGRSSLDMDRTRRKTEKKRRHQPEDENSVDLAEAGREIEAKLLGMPSSPKAAVCTTEPSDHDVFRFTDDNDSVEPSTPSTAPEKIKEKKKKRKKSKEERNRKDYHHHHHHHHHHHEKSGELPYLGAEPSPPRASSPLVSKTISSSLPAPRETLLSPIPKATSNVSTVSSITPPVVSDIQISKSEKKKDKFIPGFGIEIDETIHENAVKSISEPDEKDSNCQSRGNREEPEVPVPTTPPAQNEDKPRVAISQEETEDAVAALLEETFGASTEDFSYEGEEEETETDGITGTPAEAPQEDVEEMQQAVESLNASTVEGDADLKPDTPQSEHDLQIDTDTEEDPNYETVDLTQPPKTPDIPSFYKSPTKTLNITPILTTPEKSIEMRLPPTVVAKPQSPPSSVIAHSWTLNEHNKPRESIKPVQLETTESDIDVASPERTAQVQRTSASPPPPQYKQPMLVPCSVPMSEIPKSLSVTSSRPSPITVQPLYQRLPVSPQSQMVPMRQASPKMQTTVSCSSSSNTTPLPPLVPSRIPPLVPSQSSPRISQPLSPNGQWSRNPTLSPHVPNVGKRKASPPPTKIAVCVPIPAHRPEAPIQQIYSTAATQQPVIQHASGMLAPAPGYPRGGLPPLTLNIPPRPYMPVPPLASGIQVKNSRDSSLGGKSVIETLLPVNPNEPSQRLEEPKLSPAVIPEPTNKASTSPKVPSPNQPPTYIPETAKIEINASTSSPVFGKPAYVTDSYTMSSRTQKQISGSITTDSNLLSPRQKQEVSNLQLLTTHVPRSSTPSPVIVAHGQSHLLHKSVHTLGPPNVSSPNQPLIKTVVPIVPQQITPSAPLSVSGDKSVIPQTPCQRQSPISQSQLVKSHIPLVSTESQTIITRVVSTTASSMSTPLMNECLDRIQGQQLEVDAEAQINQTAQPMQLTPPIQSTQPIDAIKQEPVDVKQENAMDETEYNIIESEELLNQPTCVEDDIKQEKQEVVIKTEIASCIPKDEVADAPVAPKIEAETPIKLEPVNEIKEEIKENDEMELDEEPVEDPLKEPSTDPLAIDCKEDPTDNKEDSDYWSAKEVNIESVIKKVDALCDGEGNDGDDETQQTESANSDSHDTNKNESDWFDPESSIESESKKNFGLTTDEHDESMETCENEATKSRRGRAKSRRGGRGGVTTRRGGRNASTISHRRGGRSSRGSKHHVEKNKLPADVYEFHDDSEEDNAGRPRLILTIKSPGPNVTGPNAQPAIPVAAVKEIPPEEFVSPAANTRKSRRLAERDGSRSTIDDVIEDVVRGSPASKGLVSGAAGNMHATRRSTRHNNAPRNTTVQPTAPLTTELRKSPRGSRKTARRTSENNEDSGEEKVKEIAVTPQDIPIKEEPKPVQPESPKAEEPAQTVVTSAPQKTVSLEPMTLIDPVTGMLIPMRESEEGQYIPVSTASSQVQTINRTLCEPRSGGLVNASPTNETSRVKSEDPPLVTAESKKEAVIEHPSCQSASTQPIQPQTSVITKPQSPTVQVTSTITIAQSSTTTTTIVTTVTTTSVASTTTAQPIPISSSSQTKPTSLKAHVLNASKLVTSAQQQVVITKPVASSLPNQTIVQNIVKSPVQAIQGLNLQIPPGRVVSPSLSPRAKQTAQLAPANAGVKQGQPMSPVLNNTGVPPNPKQHLLQAAKQQTSTIVNMSQKMPINMHPVSVNVTRMHQPASQPTALKGINGQPHPLNPKTHLLQAVVPPIVTGNSTHLVNPQPISTGNTRPPVPKTPATGTMEPQKVEVPMSGCIMMPTASPQSRSVPMPTYEAPLHGSTGATPPGGQYGLVPPHRSQSPPLPPPAHHHVNTSQNEVVNHYGGLTRGGELPPHYLHSQMLQYQYHLRAQQEALTAPRIAYHIPGTRSPHLPLDPKLETGIEDSHSPPLELRRGTRTPQDRTTDSPQVAQVYMLHGNVRLPPPPPQYNAGSNPSLPGTPAGARAGYYEPPPAHLRSQYPMAASEAPPEMGRAATPERCRKHHVVTPPPYASQVPPQADTFQMLLQRYPVMWQGLLALKNDQAAVQMHFVFGNPNVARDSLPCNSDGSTPPLRIAQRMRLEQTQVDGVARKMQTDNEHCMLLALPCGRDEVDVLQQSKNLQTGFIMYLQQKQAAGIVNIAAPGSQQPAYVVHIFPSCEFAHENLARIAPDLHQRVAKISHLLIVIATV